MLSNYLTDYWFELQIHINTNMSETLIIKKKLILIKKKIKNIDT
jgi:hypothetical protein